MKLTYLHEKIPELFTDFLEEGNVKAGPGKDYDSSSAMKICLASVRLAIRLGIEVNRTEADRVTHKSNDDALISEAPLISALTNKKIAFLRGWKHFEGCVKGFNILGLMANQIMREQEKIKKLSALELNNLKLTFLESREDKHGCKVFKKSEFENVGPLELLAIDPYDLAIWLGFSKRVIFCSTSSNMGICAHQALRLMQNVELTCKKKKFFLLNKNEGGLVIWAPDERADFMNMEKITFLRALEKEKPQITRIRTYINRQQRDPGALKDALLSGGYFFPTNPQSKDEIQNLIFIALKKIEQEKKIPLAELLRDKKIQRTLASIDASIIDDTVIVERGLESGIYGLMIPYIVMLEEFLLANMGVAVSTWNQASIGAALAAAVLVDHILQNPLELDASVRSKFNRLFPIINQFLETNQLGKNLKTRIHGVFDLANLQSLAQLLGVVVENHLSGRGTAYVGLGSSSYSNGNRCFEILKNSMNNGGAFTGKSAFHPSTHSINPYAQALVFGEDMYRYLSQFEKGMCFNKETIENLMEQVRKPEPAGAAAMAGYLLARLDMGTLSMAELAYVLKLMGFSKNTFLEFSGFGAQLKSLRSFLQEAYEEGPNMGDFSKNMLLLLDWPEANLRQLMASEKQISITKYTQAPLDDIQFEQLHGPTVIYLTGDNCRQASRELTEKLAYSCWNNFDRIEAFLDEHSSSPLKISVEM